MKTTVFNNNDERVNNTVSNNSNVTAMRTINNNVTIESNVSEAAAFITVTINSDKTGVTTFNATSEFISKSSVFNELTGMNYSGAKVRNIDYSRFEMIALAIIAERFDENDVFESIIIKHLLHYVSCMRDKCGDTIILDRGFSVKESFLWEAYNHDISGADVEAYIKQNGISGISKYDLRGRIHTEIRKYNRDNNNIIIHTIFDFYKILGYDTYNGDGNHSESEYYSKYYINYALLNPQY